MKEVWQVEAVGTDNGRPVLFLRCQATEGSNKMAEMIVPTDNVTMATMAGHGFPIRNTNEVVIRRRR